MKHAILMVNVSTAKTYRIQKKPPSVAIQDQTRR